MNTHAALARAIQIAGEAAEEWDRAPEGMKAGKLLLSLAGHRPGYRADIDELQAVAKAPARLELPEEMTPAIRDALGMMIMYTAPIAHMRRADGHAIKERAEEEQAHVLFWFLKMAIQNGDTWREKVGEELDAIAQRAKAREAAQ